MILLGLGFTTRRVARRFLLRGQDTFAAVRDPDRFRDLSAIGLRFDRFPQGAVIVHTIPPLPVNENDAIREFIRELEPGRVVYISSTSVYGNAFEVDETTPANPCEEKRPPEDRRGALASVRAMGNPHQSDLGGDLRARPREFMVESKRIDRRAQSPGYHSAESMWMISAAVVEAGALSDLTGAWPMADDYPCPTAEVACCVVRQAVAGRTSRRRGSNKCPLPAGKVDGRKIRELPWTQNPQISRIPIRYPREPCGREICALHR